MCGCDVAPNFSLEQRPMQNLLLCHSCSLPPVLRCTTLHAGNSIGDTGTASIAASLKTCTALTDLDYGGAQACRVIDHARCPRQEQSATTRSCDDVCLCVVDNEAGSEGATALADWLKGNTTLTGLSIGGACPGAAGVQYELAASTSHACTVLVNADNHVGGPGTTAIAGVLQENAALKTLQIRGVSSVTMTAAVMRT